MKLKDSPLPPLLVCLVTLNYPNIFYRQLFIFLGLRSKQYAFEITRKDGSRVSKKTCKGIKKNTIKKHLALHHYLNSLKNEIVTYQTSTLIRADNHELSTRVIRKIATCAFDDKRYLHQDKITTSPLYYHKINDIKKELTELSTNN